MKKTPKAGIVYVLQAIYIVPLLFFGIIIMLFSSHWFKKAMYEQVSIELQNVACNVKTMFEIAYPGDYTLKGETAYHLYKGDYDLTGDYALIDLVSSQTNLDITLFYQETRILTTIRDWDGNRIVGTGAPQLVTEKVLDQGNASFYTHAVVNGSLYFSYYMPLMNSDGNIAGMLFVGKPRQEVDDAVHRCVYPLMIAMLLTTLVIAVCLARYTNSFVSVLLKIRRFLADVTVGNLNAELDSTVLKRSDELGDIGRSALAMQRSLRSMVEQDSLTQLFNRRFGDRKLKQVMDKSIAAGTPYCVAIGDIDYFKRVNDTYGHECGDVVLKNVAAVLHRHMQHTGFAARWGGEEFLLVFDHMDLDSAYASLCRLAADIRAIGHEYQGQTVKITMTFGLVSGGARTMMEILKNADDKLYEGKNSGRNQVVY